MSKIKICCISDTHNQHDVLDIPECDLLIHAGDFSYVGKMIDVISLNNWFGKLKESGKVKEIVAIAGNHDWFAEQAPPFTKELFTNCIYLNEESAEVLGFKIFGSPIQPEFCDWAFNRKRGAEIAKNWAKIPDDTEILVTHGPPHGILDKLENGMLVGCEELLKKIDVLKNLKLHVFGHIHCANGEYVSPDGKIFVNAAICNEEYKPIQPAHLITLEK